MVDPLNYKKLSIEKIDQRERLHDLRGLEREIDQNGRMKEQLIRHG